MRLWRPRVSFGCGTWDDLTCSYCFVITPVNYPLAAVNFFVGVTGLVQLARIAKCVYACLLTHSYKYFSGSSGSPILDATKGLSAPAVAAPDMNKKRV